MKKILIAIDPFETKLRPSSESLLVLQNWLRSSHDEVEAVYVHSSLLGDEVMRKAAEQLEIDTSFQVRVLLNESNTQKNAIHTFLKYVRESKVDFIVLLSHGRKWISRLVLGSFSEGVLAQSPVPVLFLGSEREAGKKSLSRVMFPTDFSEASKKAYRTFIGQIQVLQVFCHEIILYHHLSSSDLLYGFAGDGYVVAHDQIREQRAWATAEGERWVKEGNLRGFKVDLLIDEGSESVFDAIQKTAKRLSVSLLGIASTQRPLESAILGSTATELFRSRKHPVWVMGPTALNEYQITRVPLSEKTRDKSVRIYKTR